MACQAMRGGIPLGCYVVYGQGREPSPGWAGEEVLAHDG
jgi:D-hexose-6-phosphate mutarotase